MSPRLGSAPALPEAVLPNAVRLLPTSGNAGSESDSDAHSCLYQLSTFSMQKFSGASGGHVWSAVSALGPEEKLGFT